MPPGRVHTNVTLMAAGVFTVAAIVNLNPSDLQYALGALVGVVVQPDLDVDHGRIIAYKVIRQRLGSLPYYTWRVVWYMYRRSLKHGGDLSHFPIVSTMGRLIYLFLFTIAIPYLFIAPVLHLNIWYELNWWLWKIVEHYKIILGLMTVDFFHWLLDVITTEHKVGRNHDTQVEERQV